MTYLLMDPPMLSWNLLTYLLILISFISTVRSETCLLSNISYRICSSSDTNLGFESNLFTRTELFNECQEHFIQKILNKSCHSSSISSTHRKKLTRAESYGYAFLAVFIISILSIMGLFIFPFLYSVSYKYVVNLFTALAVGTLFGDTMFHLIPYALGVHNHGKDKHSSFFIPDYTWKMLISVSILYFFYLLEIILHSYSYSKYTTANINHHSHMPMNEYHQQHTDANEEGIELIVKKTDTNLQNGCAVHSHVPDEINTTSIGNSPNKNDTVCVASFPLNESLPKSSIVSYGFKQCSSKTNGQKSVSSPMNDFDKKAKSKKNKSFAQNSQVIASTGWLILIGDTIHNFADGLAMGAAFSQDLVLGITTTLAIGLHELPHEFGDYAILIRSGFSHSQAIMCNCLSATTAFIGCFIGVALSSDDHIREWIFSITIGIFIYIALVDLLPTLFTNTENDLKCFIFVNFGIIIGITIMFLLAIFEDGFIRPSN